MKKWEDIKANCHKCGTLDVPAGYELSRDENGRTPIARPLCGQCFWRDDESELCIVEPETDEIEEELKTIVTEN